MDVLILIAGMLMVALGGQGSIRQLLDHEYAGLLSWLPVEWGARLAIYAVVLVIGLVLAGRAGAKLKREG